MEIQAAHKSRTRERKAHLKLLEAQSANLQDQLGRLEPVIDLRNATDAVVVQFDELQQNIQSVERLAEHRLQMQHQQTSIMTEQQILARLDELPAWPEFHETEPLEDWILEFQTTQEQFDLYQKRASALQQLTPPPELADVKALMQNIEARCQYDAQQQRWQSELRTLKSLQAPPALEIDMALQQTVVRWKQLLDREKTERNTLSAVLNDITTLQTETQTYVKQHPTCPVCNQPWQMNHLLSEGHPHG